MEARLKDLLAEKAGQIDIEIVPDHVHLFVKATPVNSFTISVMKGIHVKDPTAGVPVSQ